LIDVAAIEAALSGLRIGYEADGYSLQVEGVSSDRVVKVRIAAGPNACEECLVPKPIATGTIKGSLQGLPVADVEVAYPTDA
jgi:hypothetical protein